MDCALPTNTVSRAPSPFSRRRRTVQREIDGMVTIREVARAAGVSVSTVSNALNGRPNVSRDVRQKIQQFARELGYRPNRAAQTMRTGLSRAIGLVLPDLTNPFFPQLAQAV